MMDKISSSSWSSSINNSKPIIVILGSGAIGCYYGARLVQTRQYHVYFYMRSASSSLNSSDSSSYAFCKAHGLKITSIHGDIFIPPSELHVFDSTQSILEAIYQLRPPSDESSPLPRVDWVILGFKSTILDQDPGLYPLIRPFLSPKTRVLAIMNGFIDTALVGCIEQRDTPQPIPEHPFLLSLTICAAVYAGMAFICCNRILPGHIHHTFAGKLATSLSAMMYSSPTCNSWEELGQIHVQAITSLFSYTHEYFEMRYMDNLIKARWTKNLWNLPFNGISVAMGGITTDCIVQDVGLRQLALKIMEETLKMANQDLSSRGYSTDCFLSESEVWLVIIGRNAFLYMRF